MQTGENQAPFGRRHPPAARSAPGPVPLLPGLTGSGPGEQLRVNLAFNWSVSLSRRRRRGRSGRESAAGCAGADAPAARPGHPRWPTGCPRRPPPGGRDGGAGLSSVRMSETNFCLIASLKNKTSAVSPPSLPPPPPPRRHAGFRLFLPVGGDGNV